MSYADALRAATPTLETAATLIEGLLITDLFINSDTLRSSSSGSLVDITSMSGSLAVEANERVLIIGSIQFSHGTSNESVALSLARAGSGLYTKYNHSFRASTAGFDSTMTVFGINAPGAGTHTYSLQWATGSGTVYSGSQTLIAIAYQNT